MPAKQWKAKKLNDILQIDVEAKPTTKWEQWVMLRSDCHWDNVKSDRALQRLHLKKAQDRNAIVLDGGDLFCAMQGKGDPRSSKNAVRAEHNKTNYLDALVNTATKWHQPFKDQFAMLAHGNHELGVYDRKETDLTERLAYNLGVTAMPITGFVRFIFRVGASRYSYLLHYHHGYGGGGPVTKDVIQANRKAVYTDADIVWSGHTHDSWWLTQPKLEVSKNGSIRKRLQHHIKTPTYKDDYDAGHSNWANTKGHPPKPLGCMWLRFYYYCAMSQGKETPRRIALQVVPDLVANKLDGE